MAWVSGVRYGTTTRMVDRRSTIERSHARCTGTRGAPRPDSCCVPTACTDAALTVALRALAKLHTVATNVSNPGFTIDSQESPGTSVAMRAGRSCFHTFYFCTYMFCPLFCSRLLLVLIDIVIGSFCRSLSALLRKVTLQLHHLSERGCILTPQPTALSTLAFSLGGGGGGIQVT